MSDQNMARRAVAQVNFAGVDITKDIRKYLLSLTYTDNAEDEADDLQIKLQDREGLWTCHWLADMVNAAASPASATLENAPEEGSEAAVPGTLYTVNARAGLRVRAGPGTNYARLGALPYGTEVLVSSISGNWGTIDYNGRPGYLYVPYLKQGGSGAAPSAADNAAGTDEAAKAAAETDLKIQAVIVRQNWKGNGKDDILECGAFELDTVDASGPPSTVTVKATALSYRAPIRQTERSQAWESYKLSGIAREIAERNGMGYLVLSASDPYYERIEQFQLSDIKFLERLCHNAGISLKVTNRMLVCFDQADYEKKDSVLTIKRDDKKSWLKYKLSVSSADSEYQSCRVSYTDPDTGKVIMGAAYVEDYKEDAKDNKELVITTEKVGSIGEAEALARKRLRMANKYAKTVSFTFPGDPSLLAGLNVKLDGWGAWDMKYSITTAKHTLSSSGYTTQIEARAVLEGY